MRPEDDDYVPGEDVTELARPKKDGGTLVLSVRLGRSEVAALEAIAVSHDLALSEALKAAVREYIAARGRVLLTSPQKDDNYDLPGAPTPQGLGSPVQSNFAPNVSLWNALPQHDTDVRIHRERKARELTRTRT
jgi:hypothetical protein